MVDRMRGQLEGMRDEFPVLRSVVLSGSLARLDACDQSDVDLIIVLHDEMDPASREVDPLLQSLWERLTPLGMRCPQMDGVFARPTTRRQLCDVPCGVVDEQVDVFGKRIQLLLESRPVLGGQECEQLQAAILRRYLGHPFSARKGESWSYLMDDLMRYWRSYRVWRHWDLKGGNGGWCLRNVKLRHSRLLTYASLLLSCAISDGADETSLLPLLCLTPLERIRHVDQQVGGDAFESISNSYGRFLEAIDDPSLRRELEEVTPATPGQALAVSPDRFRRLLDNGDELRGSLLGLLRVLPASKSDDIVSRLIF